MNSLSKGSYSSQLIKEIQKTDGVSFTGKMYNNSISEVVGSYGYSSFDLYYDNGLILNKKHDYHIYSTVYKNDRIHHTPMMDIDEPVNPDRIKDLMESLGTSVALVYRSSNPSGNPNTINMPHHHVFLPGCYVPDSDFQWLCAEMITHVPELDLEWIAQCLSRGAFSLRLSASEKNPTRPILINKIEM